jgi:hypothetical protein
VKRLFGFLLLISALCGGCATTSAIVGACKPPATDETEAITDLFQRADISTVEAIGIAEGGAIAVCVVSEIARDILAKASEIHFSQQLGTESPLIGRSQSWLAKHS